MLGLCRCILAGGGGVESHLFSMKKKHEEGNGSNATHSLFLLVFSGIINGICTTDMNNNTKSNNSNSNSGVSNEMSTKFTVSLNDSNNRDNVTNVINTDNITDGDSEPIDSIDTKNQKLIVLERKRIQRSFIARCALRSLFSCPSKSLTSILSVDYDIKTEFELLKLAIRICDSMRIRRNSVRGISGDKICVEQSSITTTSGSIGSSTYLHGLSDASSFICDIIQLFIMDVNNTNLSHYSNIASMNYSINSNSSQLHKQHPHDTLLLSRALPILCSIWQDAVTEMIVLHQPKLLVPDENNDTSVNGVNTESSEGYKGDDMLTIVVSRYIF